MPIRLLLIVALSLAAAGFAEETEREAAAQKIRQILKQSSDAELVDYLKLNNWNEREKSELAKRIKAAIERQFSSADWIGDFALSEVIRRGRADWEKRLLAILNSKEGGKDDFDLEGSATILTTLRRIQKKPDPLQVELTAAKEIEAQFPFLPDIEAALVNRDQDKATLNFQEGGDYRSGRQDRWRFEVTRKDGTKVSIKERWGVGGGLSGGGTLKPGESWKTMLNMNSFLPVLEPGEYSIRVQYHDVHTISNEKDMNGWIVSTSAPFKLTVKPAVVELSAADRKKAREWVRSVPAGAPLRILAGSYSDDYHDFIAPDSAQGKILKMGFSAVPALLDELFANDLPMTRRAWVLSLLFSLTSCHDPREARGVIGSYESKGGGWQIVGGKGNHEIMGLGFSEGRGTGGAPDEKKQREFAELWRDWQKFIKVKAPKDEKEF